MFSLLQTRRTHLGGIPVLDMQRAVAVAGELRGKDALYSHRMTHNNSWCSARVGVLCTEGVVGLCSLFPFLHTLTTWLTFALTHALGRPAVGAPHFQGMLGLFQRVDVKYVRVTLVVVHI